MLRSRWIGPGLAALAFLLYAAAIDGRFLGFAIDDGHYLFQARRFARGDLGRQTMHFPIGFPLLLAPLVRALPDVPEGIVCYKALPAALAALAVAVVHALVRRLDDRPGRALVVAVLTGLGPVWFRLAGQVMSDLPFALVAAATLLVHCDLVRNPRSGPGRRIALVGLVVAAVAIRVIGLALVVALAADCLLRLRSGSRPSRADLATAAGLAVALAGWIGFVDRTVPFQFGYKIYPGWERSSSGWPEGPPMPVRLAGHVAGDLPEVLVPALETRTVRSRPVLRRAGRALAAAIALLVLVGAVERWPTGRTSVLYGATTMVVLSLQVAPVARFLVPISFVGYDLLLAGVDRVARRLGRPGRAGPALALVVVACLFGSVVKDARAIAWNLTSGHPSGPEVAAEERDLLAALDRVAAAVEPDRTVGFHWPWPDLGEVYHPDAFRSVHVRSPRQARAVDYVFLYPCRPGAPVSELVVTCLGGSLDDPDAIDLAARLDPVLSSPDGRHRLFRVAGPEEPPGESR